MKGDPTKVYLSKSNLASVEDVRLVREYLLKLGYEIIEHDGGIYDPTLLEIPQLMVMIGYAEDNGDDIIPLGKGQYHQLAYRQKRGFDYNYNLYFSDLEFFNVETNRVIDENNWKKDYGTLVLVDEAWIDDAPVARHPRPKAVSEPTTLKCSNGMISTDPETGAVAIILNEKIYLACINLLE